MSGSATPCGVHNPYFGQELPRDCQDFPIPLRKGDPKLAPAPSPLPRELGPLPVRAKRRRGGALPWSAALLFDAKLSRSFPSYLFRFTCSSRINLDHLSRDNLANWIAAIDKMQRPQRERECAVEPREIFRLDLSLSKYPIDRHRAPTPPDIRWHGRQNTGNRKCDSVLGNSTVGSWAFQHRNTGVARTPLSRRPQ